MVAEIMDYLPIIIPLLLLQLILMVTALLHLIRKQTAKSNNNLIIEHW
ncbi:MAG: hypothetical protein U5K84_00355 [Alkalibacterium sp.]|nr:hypothetical protein [Alkalibacterium sp.]